MTQQQSQPVPPQSESLLADGWVEVDREKWDDGTHEYQARVVARTKPAPPPKPPQPRKVLRVGSGDIEVEPPSVSYGVRTSSSVGVAPRVVPLRRAAAVLLIAWALAVWLGYAWGHAAGRAEVARDVIRAGVHRLADRPALVDTIEDASGWDADTRESERQRARDERGR